MSNSDKIGLHMNRIEPFQEMFCHLSVLTAFSVEKEKTTQVLN